MEQEAISPKEYAKGAIEDAEKSVVALRALFPPAPPPAAAREEDLPSVPQKKHKRRWGPKKETSRHRKMFQTYLELRSIRKVAQEYEMNEDWVAQIAYAFGWKQKMAEHDRCISNEVYDEKKAKIRQFRCKIIDQGHAFLEWIEKEAEKDPSVRSKHAKAVEIWREAVDNAIKGPAILPPDESKAKPLLEASEEKPRTIGVQVIFRD